MKHRLSDLCCEGLLLCLVQGGFGGVATVPLGIEWGYRSWDGMDGRGAWRRVSLGSRAAVALGGMPWALPSCSPMYPGRQLPSAGPAGPQWQRTFDLGLSLMQVRGPSLIQVWLSLCPQAWMPPQPHTALPASTPVPGSPTCCALSSSRRFLLLPCQFLPSSHALITLPLAVEVERRLPVPG